MNDNIRRVANTMGDDFAQRLKEDTRMISLVNEMAEEYVSQLPMDRKVKQGVQELLCNQIALIALYSNEN